MRLKLVGFPMLLVVASMISCKVVDQQSESTVDFATLKLANDEISGWTQGGVQYTVSSGGWATMRSQDELKTLIDGQYDMYFKRGWVDGAVQELIYSDQVKNAVSKILNQGSAVNATSLFQDQVALIPSTVAVPGFAQTVAVGMSGGMTGTAFYAHIKNIFIELTISGYPTEADAANAAALFLTTYQNKAK